MSEKRSEFGRRGRPLDTGKAKPERAPSLPRPAMPKSSTVVALAIAGAVAASGVHFSERAEADTCVPTPSAAPIGNAAATLPPGDGTGSATPRPGDATGPAITGGAIGGPTIVAPGTPCPPGTTRHSGGGGYGRRSFFWSWSSGSSSSSHWASSGGSSSSSSVSSSSGSASHASLASRGGFGATGAFHFSGGS